MKRSKFYDEAVKRRDSLFDIAFLLRTLSVLSDREYRVSITGNRIYILETFIDNKPVDSIPFCETFYLCHYLLKEIDKVKEKRGLNKLTLKGESCNCGSERCVSTDGS